MEALAKALGKPESEVKAAVKSASLSGDEMVSLAYAYGFDYAGDGSVNDKLITIAYGKIEAQLKPAPKPKKKTTTKKQK